MGFWEVFVKVGWGMVIFGRRSSLCKDRVLKGFVEGIRWMAFSVWRWGEIEEKVGFWGECVEGDKRRLRIDFKSYSVK